MIRSLAWRSITSRKLRAALNGIGIILGVALIFSVISLSQTIVSTFNGLFDDIYGATDVIISGQDSSGTISAATLEEVRSTGGVESVSTTVSTPMTLVRNGTAGSKQKDQVYAAGIIPSEPDLTGAKTVQGRDVKSGDEIQLEEGFVKDNGFKVGETLKLATQSGIRSFTLVGVVRFASQVNFGGSGLAAIPQATAREITGVNTGYSEIDVKIKGSANVDDVQTALEGVVGRGITVDTPTQKSEDITSDIQGFTGILYFFAGMALFAGGYLILNSFNMTIAQRLREIGMLRTLGASRKQIRRMILWEALLLGVLGSIIGILLGLLLTHGLTSLLSAVGFPLGAIEYPPGAFIAAPLVGLAATLFGALRPAIRAGRIAPIRAVLAEHGNEPVRSGRRVVIGSICVLLGLAGVFTLASSDGSSGSLFAGALGVILLFTGTIWFGPLIVPPIIRVLSFPLRKLWPIEARLAADSSKSNPVRTASTASGLMIGIALVGAIGTLGASFIGSLSKDLDKEIKTDFTVQPKAFGGGGPQATISPDAIAQIKALPGVKLASGNRSLYLTDGFDGGSWSAYSYDPASHLMFSSPDYKGGTATEVNAKVEAGEVTLPESLLKSKKLSVGDTVKLSGPRGEASFRVAGTLSSNSLEASAISMSNASFDKLFGIPGYSQIEVLAKTPEDRKAASAAINGLLAKSYPTFESLSNEQIKKQIKDQINQFFSIFYAIMIVAILVSLLGVVNTLIINVIERTREIGVLRAIGSSRLQVRSVITQESLLLTSAGAVLGLVVGMILGYMFVKGISSSSINAQFHPPIAVIVGVAILAVIAGLLAAILPARRAAHMNVIEAVSYE
ncbi:MAG: ABC transporter permease [Solirubrobacterales bacterium]